MRVGILRAGDTPRRLAEEFGRYPAMFESLLDGNSFDWQVFDAPDGNWPEAPDACDAYIVTGSAASVYDPDPWIGDLFGFLRRARGKAKLVGICFGHQALAQAFGGQVVRSPKGWGVGLHTYAVDERRGWMDAGTMFSLAASHQDQVVELPPGATRLAGSDFCPNGMLAYGDEAISLQLHPEFSPDYATALIAGRRGDRIPDDLATQAIESLKRPNDHERVAGWLTSYLNGG